MQNSNMLLLNRSVWINFNYCLGKMDVRRSCKKICFVRNDDLMSGGDSGGSMGGGSMQGGGGLLSGVFFSSCSSSCGFSSCSS